MGRTSEALLRRSQERVGPSDTVTRAKRLFTDASRTYSASVTAQGASIALNIRDAAAGESALKLGRALINDTDAIDNLVVTANSMHRAHNKDVRVTPWHVIDVASADFAEAEVMHVLTSDSLRMILASYTALHSSGTFGEISFRRGVHAMLQAEHDKLGNYFEVFDRINALALDLTL